MSDLVENYLSKEQRAEIAAEIWRETCRDYFARIGHGVAISNVAYPVVREAIDEVLGGKADALIAEKAIEVIEGLTSYTVFHAPNIYDKTPSESWKTLQKVVSENEDKIRQRIAHHIHNLSKSDALEIIKGAKLTIQIEGEK